MSMSNVSTTEISSEANHKDTHWKVINFVEGEQTKKKKTEKQTNKEKKDRKTNKQINKQTNKQTIPTLPSLSPACSIFALINITLNGQMFDSFALQLLLFLKNAKQLCVLSLLVTQAIEPAAERSSIVEQSSLFQWGLKQAQPLSSTA